MPFKGLSQVFVGGGYATGEYFERKILFLTPGVDYDAFNIGIQKEFRLSQDKEKRFLDRSAIIANFSMQFFEHENDQITIDNVVTSEVSEELLSVAFAMSALFGYDIIKKSRFSIALTIGPSVSYLRFSGFKEQIFSSTDPDNSAKLTSYQTSSIEGFKAGIEFGPLFTYQISEKYAIRAMPLQFNHLFNEDILEDSLLISSLLFQF